MLSGSFKSVTSIVHFLNKYNDKPYLNNNLISGISDFGFVASAINIIEAEIN
jgi:hypothetical protein